MLKIRLQRAGRRNLPHYRIVLAESSAPVKGRFLEKLGHYNPRTKDFGLNQEAVLGWLGKGVKPSNTMARLLLKQGLKHNQIVYIQKKPKASKQKIQVAQTVQVEQEKMPAPVEEQPKQAQAETK